MENNAIIFVSSAEVMGCIVMAFVFLLLPLPSSKGIKKYRISLQLLSGAYLLLALLKIIILIFNLKFVNILSIESLVISSFQAILFTLALLTLINPQLISIRYIYNKILPIIILLLLCLCFSYWLGNPEISSFSLLNQYLGHPTIIIREITLIYYIYLLISLTKEFQKQEIIYLNEINNYFSENTTLQLSWVKYCFYAALTTGLIALCSFIIVSEVFSIMLDVLFTLFYISFGIFYIQYPRTFVFIEPAIISVENPIAEFSKNTKRRNWIDLKNQIINEKYFLITGVNIEDMALHLKIGRTLLSTMINNEEKVNFNSWINLLRIEEAKYLLTKNPNLSLSQIAEMIGYTESSNFSRQFKQITNQTPFVWRQENLKN